MTNQTSNQTAVATSIRKLTATSKDGKWKSFLSVPGLMQYLPSGQFYARIKVKGTVKRASLETDVFSTAKDRLPMKRKELLTPVAPAQELGTFQNARVAYLAEIESHHALTDSTKKFWQCRVAALLKSWPKLDGMNLADITVAQCRTWGKKFSDTFAESTFNNTLAVLQNILEGGGLGTDKNTNPAYALSRLGIKPKELVLPEPKEFEKLVLTMAAGGKRQSRDCADLVEFLAYSGCRISEARQVTWQDVHFNRMELKVHSVKRAKKSAATNIRFVPINAALLRLLQRLAVQQPDAMPMDRVCVFWRCEQSLTHACKKLGIARLTHHSLRHFFASICIESGVDIPTVSRWLGHLDGGVLAMRIYGHLRRTHSQDMAAKVTFGQTFPLLIANQKNQHQP